MAIELVGGPLYQWDTGREVKITTAGATEAHFAVADSQRALVAPIEDGVAAVPASLLTVGRTLAVWASDGGSTRSASSRGRNRTITSIRTTRSRPGPTWRRGCASS